MLALWRRRFGAAMARHAARMVAYARVAAVLLVALCLGACFSSRPPLIGARESVKLFGEGGPALRVAFSAMTQSPLSQKIRFRWVDDGYEIFGPDKKSEGVRYRLTPLGGDWYIAQQTQQPANVADYGLARLEVEENRLWIYAPQCSALSPGERLALGLAVMVNGDCPIDTLTQLRAAMAAAVRRGAPAIGYYELAGPVTP
jgi:hypothetical protein